MPVPIRFCLVLGALALLPGFADPPASEPDAVDSAVAMDGLCASGKQQSPIDLGGAMPVRAPAPHPDWTPAHGGMLLNTGHTIQADLRDAGSLDLNGARYTLKQMHFHHPSEHTLDGKRYPMEAHFVHQSADGRLAVIGVMFEEGAANPMLDRMWSTAPARAGRAAVSYDFDLNQLSPASGGAYRYEGSLTTAPCSENVSWTVMAQPVEASHAQLEAFAALFPNNARSVQPLNRRYVLKTE